MHSANVVLAWVLDSHDRVVAAAQRIGFDLRELGALTLIGQHPGCSVDWLRQRSGLTQSGTVRLVDRLEARALVARAPTQGRSVALRVTVAGDAQLKAWRLAHDDIVEALLGSIPHEQRLLLRQAFAAALTGRGRLRPEADRACRTCAWERCGDTCPVDASVQDGE